VSFRVPRRVSASGVLALALGASLLPTAVQAQVPTIPALPSDTARGASPVILTGSQLATWSRPAADGVAEPYPSGASEDNPIGDLRRTAHNGTIVVPPNPSGVTVGVDDIAAYSWTGTAWKEVPVQVDERFPYFLANGRSGFGFYSGTDKELTYAWNPNAHTAGEEAWKKMFGQCAARYGTAAEVAAAAAATNPFVTFGPQEYAEDYTAAMADPAVGLDDDDEIALQARDAGPLAPPGTPAPAGTAAALPPQGSVVGGQTVAIADPKNPAATKFIYLFLQPGGSSFTHQNSEIKHVRDANADEFIDRGSFTDASPEKLGTSNTGYGPNLPGTVCNGPNGTTAPRNSSDRFPRDGMTISTPTYQLYASGRWMVRDYKVAKPTQPGTYGPDLIDRWKGRAFQQSPDSSVSVVGFEDEQVNWEANGALLGWRAGAVRVIRETWGADSGTNVTKTETFYRDADVYRYRVRVHPIPSDGLYTSWDYNKDVASLYYNPTRPDGVPIDGVNDDTGNVDSIPGSGNPAFVDACDPTFDVCSAVGRTEQVAGKGDAGSAVYSFEILGPTSALNFSAVPYYRDDACLDDGTGDAPVNRPWPGEASTDSRVKQGYVDYWKAHGAPATLTYADLACDPANVNPLVPQWKKTPFQGAYASHGIHFFVTGDTDNATLGVPATEIDGQQWRYAVPMATPRNATLEYGPNVTAPLKATAVPYGSDPSAEPVVPELPWAPLAPLVGLGLVGWWMRRRSMAAAAPAASV
jgi:hypothetical protein